MTSVKDESPVLGVIALDRDMVVEDDLHWMVGRGVSIMTTRIPLRRTGSAAHLLELADHVESGAGRLRIPATAVIAFACTSAVALIGEERIGASIGAIHPGVTVIDPLRSIADGLARLNARRIALVSPYPTEISGALVAWFEARGRAVVRVAGLPGGYSHYAAVPPEVVADVAVEAASGVDAVVVACTDLRAALVIQDVEAQVGRPMLTSNQALAWKAAKTLEVRAAEGPGALFGS